MAELTTDVTCICCRARATLLPRLRMFALVAAVALLATAAIVALRPHVASHVARSAARPAVRPHPSAPARPVRHPDVVSRAAAAIGADAAQAFDRPFFFSSPGGIDATAARVGDWKAVIARAVRGTGVSPRLLAGLVFVESSGRNRVTAGDRAGLTQLSLWRARALGLAPDRRFAPLAELRATVRYLVRARQRLGRMDLAVASYHLGVRRLAAAHGRPYASLYFGAAHDALGSQRDYYWKVLAAERVLRVFQRDPGVLAFEGRLQARKNSAEEVLHPRTVTMQFHTPNQLARAWQDGILRAVPPDARRTHILVSPALGQLAHRLGRSRRLYRGLRPAALDVLLYIGAEVHALSGARHLILTSAVRDDRYQRVLTSVNAAATRAYSMHTTGYAFDILRSYSSVRERDAFHAVLDRLQAVGAIAYINELAAVHVAVASDAAQKLALLREIG